MALQTHYEVHVRQSGRWSIHAQFASDKKDKAVEEAKQLDSQGNIGAVKVIREVYDTNKGTHRDYLVYKTAGVTASESETDTTGRSVRNNPDTDDDEDDEDDDEDTYNRIGEFIDLYATPSNRMAKRKNKGDSKTKITIIEFIVRTLLIILFSLVIASISAVIVAESLGGSILFGYRITGALEANILFVVFVGAFLISAGFMSLTFIKRAKLEDDSPRPRAPRRPRAPHRQRRQRRQHAASEAEAKAAAAAEAEAETVAATAAARKKFMMRRRGDELDQAMAGSEHFILPEPEADKTTDHLHKEIFGDEAAHPDAGNAGNWGVATMSPHAEKQKAYMLGFLSDSLKAVGVDAKKMDNYNKFGINLFLAGACETLANNRNLDGNARARVLADSVRVMGFKESHATTFADKYEEYLLQDPRYMQMYQAGRDAMNIHFEDPDNAPQHITSALSDWNDPKKLTTETGPITVLFTDIAGSMAMTQALGDAAAQQVVHTHNRIVRAALVNNQGREVKHTGDGIMASFSRVTDSLDASIEMQRRAMIHNQQNTNLPLHLKIGINAGEPIVEDNDLFGIVVQTSARIVNLAKAGEIYVSEIVKGICAGKAYTFSDKGEHDLKGFDGPMRLYKVNWHDDTDTADTAAAE